ncbi:alpha/beta fold hydrolase [Amycolatopsis mediterranei]|uniref:thioesterase II family protein n=1 Tax=Amycolatopsis mediterranei TaxID=33910 RepID=UPI0034144EF8
MTTTETSVLVHLAGPDDPGLELVVFPGAGAGPSSVAAWRPMLPEGWRLSAICLPGRGIRFGEPLETDVRVLVDEAAAAITRLCSAPVVLAGHSLGALWAHQVAFAVRPALLATGGCEPPVFGEPLVMPTFTEEEDRQFMRELLEALGVTDEDTLAELTDISVPIMRADIDLVRGWVVPERTLECPVVSYYGTDEDTRPLPWSGHTAGPADVVTVPGDHYFFQSSASVVLADLSRRIDRSDRSGHAGE